MTTVQHEGTAPLSPHVSRLGILVVAAGAALFVYALRRTGFDDILDGLRRVGWGFAAILALSGVRFVCRAYAWKTCVARPEQLSMRHALETLLIGDAAGNLAPLGFVLNESTKIVRARTHLSLVDTVSSIAIENVFYVLSICLVIGLGCVALLLHVQTLPAVIRLIALTGTLMFLVAAVLIAGFMVANVRVLTTAVQWLNRRGWLPRRFRARREEIEALERQVLEFTSRHRDRLPTLAACLVTLHAAAFAESAVAVTLLIGTWPGVLIPFILDAVSRLINVAFKIVPLRLGVDEAGTGLFASALGLNVQLGVTLAIVRKLRLLTWNGVGLTILAWQQLRIGRR